jgi:hypothetical protein
MAFSFDVNDSIIPVMVDIQGPTDRSILRFALDTGATQTAVAIEELERMGFLIPKESDVTQLVTGSGKVNVIELSLPRIMALGHSLSDFPVLGVEIPPEATFDGVIGKDFFRDRVLTIDFRNGTIELQ